MLRNLDWLGDLNIQYDGSTFDTDPFEPQPDGAGTIFPFWVPKPTPNKPSDSGFSLRAAALSGPSPKVEALSRKSRFRWP
jgi:hypothetical protein